MNLKDSHLLVTLSREKNLTHTAKKLFISQPAITYRLRQIEEIFNTKIVHRMKKGVIFTEEGERIVEFAQHLINEFQKTKDVVDNMSKETSGTLRLAVTTTFAQYKFAPLVKIFLEKFPKVDIQMQTGKSNQLVDAIYNNEVHISFIRGDYEWPEKKELINEERICIISKTPLDLNKLPEYPRVFYKTEQFLNELITKWWNEHFDIPSFNIMEVDRADACRDFAKIGLGYSIVPEVVLTDITKDMYIYPLKNKHGMYLKRNTWMLYREKDQEIKVVKAFMQFIFHDLKTKHSLKIIDQFQ